MSFKRSTGLACAAMVGAAMTLAACEQPQPRRASTARLYATDQAGGAKSCAVPDAKTPAPGKEVPATMTLGNDGGWCAITVENNGRPFSAGLLSARPAHGRVFVHTVGDATRIDYTPDAGYAGSDSFAVRLLPGEGVVRASVTVRPG